MLIRAGYEIEFEIPAPVCILMLLYVHPEREKDLERQEKLVIEPNVPVETFIDGFGNKCSRILAPIGRLKIRNDICVRDSGELDEVGTDAEQHPIENLPTDVLPFLLASRYCEVDRMNNMAWLLFGQTRPGWERVRAISDWAHQRIVFNYQHADPMRSACGAYEDQRGVCRDYMHLAVTMMRCMNIPARYATGYLGDIGIPAEPVPMDFSAWFEVYLGNRWWTLDARHNKPRIGRILMARGRDAVDAALTTSFGASNLAKFEVWTDEVK